MRSADYRSRPVQGSTLGGFQLQLRLGLAGWVRNRADGSVEALAHGAAPAVQALIDWAHQGPALARGDGVIASEVADDYCYGAGFVQKETL